MKIREIHRDGIALIDAETRQWLTPPHSFRYRYTKERYDGSRLHVYYNGNTTTVFEVKKQQLLNRYDGEHAENKLFSSSYRNGYYTAIGRYQQLVFEHCIDDNGLSLYRIVNGTTQQTLFRVTATEMVNGLRFEDEFYTSLEHEMTCLPFAVYLRRAQNGKPTIIVVVHAETLRVLFMTR